VIRPARADDEPALAALRAELTRYQRGLAPDHPSFCFDEEAAHGRAADAGEELLVAEEDGEVVGFAALSPVSRRDAYRGVAENTVDVSARARGRGVGSALLNELVRRSEDAGIWTIQTSIFPENLASLAVHMRAGFRVVGRRERIGQLRGEWRDTFLLERRAP
jgi:L-amino acid N-acyltransferase YncA